MTEVELMDLVDGAEDHPAPNVEWWRSKLDQIQRFALLSGEKPRVDARSEAQATSEISPSSSEVPRFIVEPAPRPPDRSSSSRTATHRQREQLKERERSEFDRRIYAKRFELVVMRAKQWAKQANKCWYYGNDPIVWIMWFKDERKLRCAINSKTLTFVR